VDGAICGVGGGVPAEIAQVIKLQIDAHLVVLERNQRERQTRVAAEPELQGNVQGVLRRAAGGLNQSVGRARRAVRIAALSALLEHIHQLGHVTHHLGVTGLLAGLLG